MSQPFSFAQLVAICCETHREWSAAAARAIDTHLVARNFLIGHYVVQYEQAGADRAEYGKRTLKVLSQSLNAAVGRGFSVDNLELMRRFYQHFAVQILRPAISDTASRISGPVTPKKSETPSRIFVADQIQFSINREIIRELPQRFTLGWSHYVELLSISDEAERRFYEIETAANQWSVRELQRQIASSLYQRLALSRDKDEIRRLAIEGQVVEKVADLIKNPLVLEFLGLEEHPHYSEDELETAIINKLEKFLLERGKGFLFEARQKRFTFDNDHFFVDLVFYNRLTTSSKHDPGGKARPARPEDSQVTAVFSKCQRYRYQLREIWEPSGPLVFWLLMNPSAACLDFTDPTLRKTGKFARSWGFGRQLAGNLHAYRTTDKNRLLDVKDPIGPRNGRMILKMADKAETVVLAYGRPPKALRRRSQKVVELLRHHPGLCYLRLSQDGTPMHPLCLPKTLIPVPYC